MSRIRIAAVVVVAATAWGGVGVAMAAPPEGNVGPHVHYVNTGNGNTVRVGPEACENGPSHQFDNFHNNVHLGRPGGRGVVTATLCE